MPKLDTRRFPDDFIFGAATAAFQIEGYPLADGATDSNWYRFTHTPGKIDREENADIACDHYHKYKEDLDHLAELGVDSYRFSIAWPRIEPEPGKENPLGVDYYNRIIDGLLERGISPLVTLFHWDAPGWFVDEGDFLVRSSVDRFTSYAELAFRRFGDRVKRWITINEPMVYAAKGYLIGGFPPDKKYAMKKFFRATHHLLFAHARAIDAGRAFVPDGDFGIAEAQIKIMPARNGNERDVKAASQMDAFVNRLFIDPIVHGIYPRLLEALSRRRLPKGWQDDLEAMHPPLDFIGLNYYTGTKYRCAAFRPFIRARRVADENAPRSALWEVHPSGLYDLLYRMKTDYGDPKILITENGYPISEEDAPIVEDRKRTEYLYRHLKEVLRARAAGVRCDGYYAWSLLDNFEWDSGYKMRFGLIRVDYDSLERTWKRSAHWFANVIHSRLLEAEIDPI